MRVPAGVWTVSGREVRPAESAPVTIGEDDPTDLAELVAVIEAHGAEPVYEHGVLRAEVLGLEVARVVGDRLEVGVGRHDRSARMEMRPGEDLGAALDEAVEAVRARRRPGVPRHPANTLTRSRWLRAVVRARPELVGLAGDVELAAVAPPIPWFDLPEAASAPCVGRLEDGTALVVVCSAGIDLDVVPTAADCRLLHAPRGQLVIAVPEGDDIPVTRRLAAALARPAEVLTVPTGWEATPVPP
jgi:hypothetical protein